MPLQARGVVLGMANFWRSEKPEPFDEEDLSLAEELVARAAVCIDNARRYTREHTMAVTLQRSLLPRALPEQNALEVAYRYLPAQAGVGGDWFDVIPLPGARVALVVGDVVGHGLHAAATMGRLRTAVHNFSALDLPPDELLSHLDDLVARIDQDEAAAERRRRAITGATCLYADLRPGRPAAAPWPGPAIRRPRWSTPTAASSSPTCPPARRWAWAACPSRPPSWSWPRAAGWSSTPTGWSRTATATSTWAWSCCAQALAASRTGRRRRPARPCSTRCCPAGPTTTSPCSSPAPGCWTPTGSPTGRCPSDPAAVAGDARRRVAGSWTSWGLDELAFTTELILSELVTNAIRYGTEPIRVRLLRDRTLICEVSDGSSTSPHLRYAATTDEGGRGLFLVAQLAERWGTRYTPQGKVIWAEQPLPEVSRPPVPPPADADTPPDEDAADPKTLT